MYFDNIKFYLTNRKTGEMTIKFICDNCKEEMDKPYNYQIPVSVKNIPETWKTKYLCEKCYKINIKD